jgi:hypothetical protein
MLISAAVLRYQLTVQVIIATQAWEGVTTTRGSAYDKVLGGDRIVVVSDGSSRH